MSNGPTISPDDPIEGSWNGLRFKIATKEDHPAMLENIRLYFLIDEPMCNCLGTTPGLEESLDEYAKLGLSESGGQSLVAYDEVTGEVAGVRISHLWQKETAFKPQEPNPKMQDKNFKYFYDMMYDMGDKMQPNMFDKFGVDKVVEFHLLSVNSKYRQKNLGYELSLRAIRLAKRSGIKVVKVCYTSAFSRRIGEKLGFQAYDDTKYLEWEKDGKIVFKDMKPPHVSCVMMFKCL